MSDDNAAYSMNDLSPAAAFALCYAQALVYGLKSPQAIRFMEAQKTLPMTQADQRKALAKGLAELHEMGIIECNRDGEGDLVPTKLHEERIIASGANLVTRDLS